MYVPPHVYVPLLNVPQFRIGEVSLRVTALEWHDAPAPLKKMGQLAGKKSLAFADREDTQEPVSGVLLATYYLLLTT